MSRAEGTKPNRSGQLFGIALALVGLALACLAWRIGPAPPWPAMLVPFVIVMNGVAGLEAGPFRSVRVRQGYHWVSIVTSLCIIAAFASAILKRLQ